MEAARTFRPALARKASSPELVHADGRPVEDTRMATNRPDVDHPERSKK
jgi:hypothetical protein